MPKPPNPELPGKLLEAARELLVERGEATFSVRELCKRVGYSLTAVYRCFENRQALLQALQLKLFDEFNAHCIPSLQGGALEAVRQAGPLFISWAVAHPAEYLFMFNDYRPDSLLSEEGDIQSARSGLRGTVFLLTAAKQAGEIDIDDPEAVAIQFLTHLHGLASLALTGRLQGSAGENPAEFLNKHGKTFIDRVLGLG